MSGQPSSFPPVDTFLWLERSHSQDETCREAMRVCHGLTGSSDAHA